MGPLSLYVAHRAAWCQKSDDPQPCPVASQELRVLLLLLLGPRSRVLFAV